MVWYKSKSQSNWMLVGLLPINIFLFSSKKRSVEITAAREWRQKSLFYSQNRSQKKNDKNLFLKFYTRKWILRFFRLIFFIKWKKIRWKFTMYQALCNFCTSFSQFLAHNLIYDFYLNLVCIVFCFSLIFWGHRRK